MDSSTPALLPIPSRDLLGDSISHGRTSSDVVDNTGALIDGLDYSIQPIAIDLVNLARGDYQLPLVITSGRRSTEEQATLLQQGRTKTLQSKHIRGLAFDVDMHGMGRNAVPDWVWSELGPLGESLGLTWGGRWTTFRDVGHFEL
jgi:peptidoglycan L-alanyl-D-glutamate endopeptidase CwlK